MWIYNGKEFIDDDIGDYVGFVYIITNSISGKQYVGQKLFTRSKQKTIQKTNKETGVVEIKKKKTRVKSDWKDYYGSNEDLKKDVKLLGANNFYREILYLCKYKSDMNYWETYEIFVKHAMISDKFYNSYCMYRGNSKTIKMLL